MTTRGNGRSLAAERALRASQLLSCAVSLLGFFVLCGWALHWPLLIRLRPGFASMKPNTALLFVLLGAALGIREGERGSVPIRRGLAALVVLLAGATLLESLLRLDLGIDQLLFTDPVSAAQGLSPGRMSPAVSTCFLLLGAALCARRAGQADSRPARAGVLLAGVASVIALTGYLFGVQSLYRVGPLTS
ncbi:MAG TPA: hypothetical protein VG963_08775, partial [Polyangiaceae bacterium]|nr:hypothetical protein [Polyangiaceae bacterium]